MPEMDGYETTKMIRDGLVLNRYKQIPIIAMTANAMQGDREKCFAVGMDAYLSKPLDSGEMLQTLTEWIYVRPKPMDIADSTENMLSEDWAAGFGGRAEVDNKAGVGADSAGETRAFEAAQPVLAAKPKPKPQPQDLVIPDELITINFEEKRPSIARKPAAYIKLLGMYIDNNQQFSTSLNEAFESKDYDQVKHLVHAIKGSSGNLGMMKVYQYAAEMEEQFLVASSFEPEEIKRITELVDLSFEDASLLIQSNT